MRLTLRTLLAYMDGMLDPEDEKVLDAKIQESEFATDLVKRIRNAMKQMRLGAPKADAKGANDANLVADYLDGTLPEEQISNFERMCLDSDMNLSEVAACHQILMRVLGEPAEVRQELRERIYQTPELAAKRAAVKAPPVQSTQEEETLTKEDVEELVAPASNRSLGPAIVILVAAICVLVLLIWWPFGGPSPIAGLIGGGSEPDPNLVNIQSPDDDGENNGATAAGTQESGDGGTGSDDGNGTPATTGDTVEPMPSDGDATGGTPTASAGASTESPAGDSTGDGGAAKPGVPTDANPQPKPDDGGDTTPMPKPGDATPPAVATGDAPADGTKDGAGAPKPDGDKAATVEVATAEMGRYNNLQQLLLRLESDTWMRVSRTNMMRERDQIACPAYFRPSIAMVNGIQLIFAGPSNAALIRRDENDTPTIGLDRGRVVLVTSGKAGAAAVLAVQDRLARITFGDAESEVAIEVRDYVAPGSDIDNPTRHKVIEVYPLGGSITWTEAETDLVIRPGQVLAMTDKQPVRAYALPATPPWTSMRVSSSVAQRAAETLEPAILDGRPASLSLQEKVSFRQQETVALAIDTLCQIGEVEHAIRAFSNDKQHAYWPQHIVALRNEVARSPEHGQQVRDALAEIHAEAADKMYALIIGYSNAQLADGRAAELIADLESDQMPLRVLAYENLKKITGRSNFYQAQKNAERQKDKIRFWKELGDEDQIAYAVPPSPLPSREPITE